MQLAVINALSKQIPNGKNQISNAPIRITCPSLWEVGNWQLATLQRSKFQIETASKALIVAAAIGFLYVVCFKRDAFEELQLQERTRHRF